MISSLNRLLRHAPNDQDGDINMPCKHCRKRHTRPCVSFAALTFLSAAYLSIHPTFAMSELSPIGRSSSFLNFLESDLEKMASERKHLPFTDTTRFLDETDAQDNSNAEERRLSGDHENGNNEEIYHDDGHHDDGHGEESYEKNQPWGQVIGATLIVNLATLTGLLVVVAGFIRSGYLKMKGINAHHKISPHGVFFDIIVPSFSVGALMATTVFLILPEAIHLISGGHGHEDHGDAHSDEGHAGHHRMLGDELNPESHEEEEDSEGVSAAKFGVSVISGFLLPFLFSIFLPHPEHPSSKNKIVATSRENGEEEESDGNSDSKHLSTEGDEDGCESCMNEDIEAGIPAVAGSDADPIVDVTSMVIRQQHEHEESSDKRTTEIQDANSIENNRIDSRKYDKNPKINFHLCLSVLIGDGFHNFSDGLFIGAAFAGCSWATAMSITIATLYHEMAQEIADFVLLTRYAGLSVLQACLLNFLSGLTVTCGGIVVLAGNPSDEAIGILLAMAGGVYIYFAASETMPRLDTYLKTRKDRVVTMISLIIGTIPIGLVLLNHEHCG